MDFSEKMALLGLALILWVLFAAALKTAFPDRVELSERLAKCVSLLLLVAIIFAVWFRVDQTRRLFVADTFRISCHPELSHSDEYSYTKESQDVSPTEVQTIWTLYDQNGNRLGGMMMTLKRDGDKKYVSSKCLP